MPADISRPANLRGEGENDSAMLHLNHPIRLPADVRIVGNEEKSMTGFVKVVENLHDQIFVLRVEVPSGLISQNNLRLINHGTRNTDSLLLTAGKL